MANLKEIRGRIISVRNTQQLTKAMKMVAAAKLRRSQDRIIRLRPFANKMKEIMSHISENMGDEIQSPYTQSKGSEKILIVLITSNRGLCGGFNNNLNKMAFTIIKENYSEQHKAGNVSILCIGKKGFDFFRRRNFPLVGENHDVFADLSYETVDKVSDLVMNGFVDGTWDKVDLMYNEFKNVVVQNRTWEPFLPLAPDTVTKDESTQSHEMADYIFEPGKKEILESLIPRSLKIQFYKAILESNAGEQGARMTAMDSATDNAEELIKSLRITYNRARQAAITTEILEIVAGAEALAASN